MGTAIRYSHSVVEIEKKGPAYGIETKVVNGMDVLAVEQAAKEACDKIRATGKPYFMVCNTYRFRAHSMFDAELYRAKSEVEEWKKKDPILKMQQLLLSQDAITQDDLDKMNQKVEEEVQKAVDFAEAGTLESTEDLSKFVYSEK